MSDPPTRGGTAKLPLLLGLTLSAAGIAGLWSAPPIADVPTTERGTAEGETAERPEPSEHEIVTRIAYFREHAAEHLARVRPVVEEILGVRLDGEVPVVLADRHEWATQAAIRAARTQEADDPHGLAPVLWSSRVHDYAFLHAPTVLGTAVRSPDAIWILAENLARVELAGTWDALDVVLAHELVHVHQHRTLGLDGYLDGVRDEERLVRRAVLEGHAEWISRQAAARLGCERGFEHLARPSAHADRVPQGEFAAWRRALLTDFRYREGERFVRAVFERLGSEAALARLRSDPPRTVWEVMVPDRYLSESHAPADSVEIPAHWRVLFDVPGSEVETVATPLVQAALRPVGAAEARRTVAGLLGTRRVRVRARFGASAPATGHLLRLRFGDPGSANHFLRQFARSWEQAGAADPALVSNHTVHRAAITTRRYGERDAIVGFLEMGDRRQFEAIDVWAFATQVGGDVVVCSLSAVQPQDRAALDALGALLVAAATPGTEVGALLRAPATTSDLHAAATTGSIERRLAALCAAAAGDRIPTWSPQERAVALGQDEAVVRALAARLIVPTLDLGDALAVATPLLEDADPLVRAETAAALSAHVEDARVVALLTTSLRDPDATVRLAALDAASHQLDLDERLTHANDPDERVRLRVLQTFAPTSRFERVRAARLAATRDASPAIRARAWRHLALGMDARSLTEEDVRRGMTDPSRGVRAAMLWAFAMRDMIAPQFASMRSDDEAEPGADTPSGSAILATILDAYWNDADRAARAELLVAGWGIGGDRSRILPYARRALGDPSLRAVAVPVLGTESASAADVDRLTALIASHRDRAAAAAALGQIGPSAARARPVLRTLRQCAHATTRHAAAIALAGTGAPFESQAVFLARDLEHDDPYVRSQALLALRDLRYRSDWPPFGASTLDALLTALDDPHPLVRKSALETFPWGWGEQRPDPAVDALGRRLLDEVPWVRSAAQGALIGASLAFERLLPYARDGLTSPHADVRRCCVLLLAQHDEPRADLVPALREVVATPGDLARASAIGHLGTLSRTIPELLDDVVGALDDADPDVRGTAAAALLGVRPLTAALAERITAALDPDAQQAASLAIAGRLGELEDDVEPTVAILAHLLAGPDGFVHAACCDALQRLGYAPPAVRPGLERVLRDGDGYERDEARTTLALPDAPE